ncbi:MAG: YlxR family protein [Lachnospiraceae bacterium]|nr:YlxR family protein [Lachnospiraceae bacterium]
MNQKKEVLRQCAGCRERKPKNEMFRVIRTPDGEIEVDITGKKNGRGVYLCKNLECLEESYKRRTLDKSLKTKVPEEVYQKLIEAFKGG